ncbi:MAG: hypothetical protein AVDCRST_MAG10-2205 [uncultured Acidimicrobiales bacterium]|uniref:N-acetyltransferase domain-containing protein n=1 Tax=uncultured Acidimicrobiales bacterium TaxID=310071 RepID=A0A6J4IF01_9ACTN|nr:MAG: hypothetical protein AVDCRST_MAG10-2205 [uncultured Acidimicrobiales bacterium]
MDPDTALPSEDQVVDRLHRHLRSWLGAWPPADELTIVGSVRREEPGWVPSDQPDVPAWLRPFGGKVLVVREDGQYVAGLGIKRHDELGQEVAVATEEPWRGRGLARALVSRAASDILRQGGVPIYLHGRANAASARVAEAAGFPDRGWLILGLPTAS